MTKALVLAWCMIGMCIAAVIYIGILAYRGLTGPAKISGYRGEHEDRGD